MLHHHAAAALFTSLLWSTSAVAQDTCKSLRKEYEVLKTDGKALKDMTSKGALGEEPEEETPR